MSSWSSGGSSPLARGLPVYTSVSGAPLGIIPARAGFTPGSTSTPSHPGDHPRSRGVYVGAQSCAAADAGSSPLARGLPVETWDEGGESGIIPARAGFTRLHLSLRRAAGDHPRSRGVYSLA